MIEIKEKTPIRGPSRPAVLRGGAVAVAVILAMGVVRALVLFPFEPPLSGARLTVAAVAVVLFFSGALLLMLGATLARRMIGAQAMALASATMFIALAGDLKAWVAAGLGLLVAAGMTAWGARLAGEIRTLGGEEEKP
jgi:hypothetical protein